MNRAAASAGVLVAVLAGCAAGPDSRFGLPFADVPRCREYLTSRGVKVVGFHVFSGSQVLDAAGIIHHLRGGLELSLRAAEVLGGQRVDPASRLAAGIVMNVTSCTFYCARCHIHTSLTWDMSGGMGSWCE